MPATYHARRTDRAIANPSKRRAGSLGRDASFGASATPARAVGSRARSAVGRTRPEPEDRDIAPHRRSCKHKRTRPDKHSEDNRRVGFLAYPDIGGRIHYSSSIVGVVLATLRQRFEAFISTFDGYENIDALLEGQHLPDKNRADYLLWGRTIVVEQKSLASDPTDRVQNYADKLKAEGRLIVYGTMSIDMLSDDLRREFVLDLAKNIDAIVAKADRQTEDSREIFSIPDALGVLVILNEKAGMLDPKVIHYALANVFQKKAADGSLRYPANDGVILIPEAQVIDTPHGRRIPLPRFTSPHRRANDRFLQFSDALFAAWSSFNDVQLIKSAP